MGNSNFMLIIVISLISIIAGIGIGFFFGVIGGRSLSTTINPAIPKSPTPWLLSFTGSGIALIIAFCCLIYNIYFFSNSQVTVGTVIKVVETTNDDGGTFYYPIYEYFDLQGKRYEGKPSAGVGDGFVEGEKVNIRYLSHSPDDSRIDTFMYNWLNSIFFAIVSVLLAALGVGLKWWSEKNKRMS